MRTSSIVRPSFPLSPSFFFFFSVEVEVEVRFFRPVTGGRGLGFCEITCLVVVVVVIPGLRSAEIGDGGWRPPQAPFLLFFFPFGHRGPTDCVSWAGISAKMGSGS